MEQTLEKMSVATFEPGTSGIFAVGPEISNKNRFNRKTSILSLIYMKQTTTTL